MTISLIILNNLFIDVQITFQLRVFNTVSNKRLNFQIMQLKKLSSNSISVQEYSHNKKNNNYEDKLFYAKRRREIVLISVRKSMKSIVFRT